MNQCFSPLTLRDITFPNRVMLSPMCMYSAGDDGKLTDWHLGHYLARAVGKVGLIMLEATAVEARGRISQHDLGLWEDAQVAPLARLVSALHGEGAIAGVQLAHAGRKAWGPAEGRGPEPAVAPSALPFDQPWATPHALTEADIEDIIAAWKAAAVRAAQAGFDVIEIHAAHGYLNHQFLASFTNQRTDSYGGDLQQRMTFLLRVVDAVRSVWMPSQPLFVRLSTTDWGTPGGLTLEDSVIIARELSAHGVDLVDCSSGGLSPARPQAVWSGYQIPFAERVRRETGIRTAAVGLITAPEMADEIIRNERADLVALGRELLRHPYWALDAAATLRQEVLWPEQYLRARRA